MVINYQDPLDNPYKKPSRRRFLRGTLAKKNVSTLSAAIVAGGALMGYAMYKTVPQEKKDYFLNNPDAFALFKNESGGFVGAREQSQFIEDINESQLAIQALNDPKNWRFWKPSFWLDKLHFDSYTQRAESISQEVSTSESE